MISSIRIENFKGFRSFALDLNGELNLIVGKNEAGKSTILDAIALALTKRIHGKQLEQEISPFLFNKECVKEYLDAINASETVPTPEVVIELYLKDEPRFAALKGTTNSQHTDCPGIKLEIRFDDDYSAEYNTYLRDGVAKKILATEYFKVGWYSFAGNGLQQRSLPINVFHVDATTIRLQSGTDYYVQNIIGESLEAKDRVALSVSYRKLKETFGAEDAIKSINASLAKSGITEKALSIAMDVSQKGNWEANLVPYLDELPFQFVGKGEQTALKIMLALDRKAKDADVILIEEPETHLSYPAMRKLIHKIEAKCKDKQLLITTHSAYVLNKLGIEKLVLLNGSKATKLGSLPKGTEDYFKKLSGYDTLRLVLADKSILVEGPSDELVVQRAFQLKFQKLPLDAGTDVINVRGLSFARFLDLAQKLERQVTVVTDNDGDYAKKVTEKYATYVSAKIKVCADTDNSARTLEPQMMKVNTLAEMNLILGTTFASVDEITKHMTDNKTDWALAVFETDKPVKFPKYVEEAISA